jgi:hypothetical protein
LADDQVGVALFDEEGDQAGEGVVGEEVGVDAELGEFVAEGAEFGGVAVKTGAQQRVEAELAAAGDLADERAGDGGTQVFLDLV